MKDKDCIGKENGRYTEEFKQQVRDLINQNKNMLETATELGVDDTLGSGFRQLYYKLKREEKDGVVLKSIKAKNTGNVGTDSDEIKHEGAKFDEADLKTVGRKSLFHDDDNWYKSREEISDRNKKELHTETYTEEQAENKKELHDESHDEESIKFERSKKELCMENTNEKSKAGVELTSRAENDRICQEEFRSEFRRLNESYAKRVSDLESIIEFKKKEIGILEKEVEGYKGLVEQLLKKVGA
jgi:hypothetical protein